MKGHLSISAAWILSICLLAVPPLFAADESTASADEVAVDPDVLVKEMSVALKMLNYEGTFVHLQGMHVTTFRIMHSSGADGELERMISLDGEAREVIRNNALVTCIWPGTRSVYVSESKARDHLPQVATEIADSEHYQFSMGKPDRVAGVATYVVNVDPVDNNRYGYRFWIDQDTRMLLRSMLIDDSRTVEQVVFTDIEFPDFIDPARFDVDPNKEQLSWLEPRRAKATSGFPKALSKQVDRVQFTNLPGGYDEVSETYSSLTGDSAPVSHVMLSDGMASVSVYVEYIDVADQKLSTAGLSSMGAMNAFGVSTKSAFITAVGEVPADTVRSIAEAVSIAAQ